MLDYLKIVIQTTNTLKIPDQNLILRSLCTVVDYVLVTHVTMNTQEKLHDSYE